jgi:hypothetical protein
METNKNNEDLLYSLPDYITGKLNNEGIKHNIEEEIRINADFREEYELMKETYSSIKNLELSEPPAHYFTNLVPMINQRIESQNRITFSHIFKLANLFKYALPAVSVIVIIFIFTFSNKNNVNENMFVQTDNTITEIMKTQNDSTHEKNEAVDNNKYEEKDITENTLQSDSPQISKEKNKANIDNSVIKIGNNSVNIEELFAETEETEIYDDYVYETEFSTLSGNEQTELINKLSKTKF